MNLTREEVQARFEADETCHHQDGFVCSRCALAFKWFPRTIIEKYSIDQTAFAERKLADELSWGRRPLIAELGIRAEKLHGTWLRELFGEPEDGYAYDAGNSLVNAGLSNLAYLLLGTAASGANGVPLKLNGTTGTCGVGVGADAGTTLAFAVTNTHLGADAGSAYYQNQDATFPSWQGAGTPGQLNGQSTFASGVGNFAWNEWCWFTGTGTVTPGATLASVATNTAMFNRKIPTSSLGTKASGASWVFTQTITFS